MSGEDYAAVFKSVNAMLAASVPATYGRQSSHHVASCTVCHLMVCIPHHSCKGRFFDDR